MRRALAIALSVQLATLISSSAFAEGPPSSNGVISDPTLVANQSVAKAQAAGAISSFMSKGAQECDASGKNCHSVFGQDDTPDYAGLQGQAQSLTGAQSFNFMDKDGGSAAYQAQTGTLAVACGNTKVQQVAGVAVMVSSCHVNSNGDTTATFKVCTAPSRGLPVSPPKNAVECSTDPTAKNFKPPAGKVCKVATCDTEPVGSLNGWSPETTASWVATMPSNASDSDKAKNGLAMVFYPALSGSITPDFKADSDNMTAVKIVQSFINNQTKRTAVGFRVAYRHKATVTKDMMVAGQASVPNPQDHTNQWTTIQKLQGNALIPQYGAKYAKNGSECLQQIGNGIGNTGEISVCEQTYSNESGIKPLAKTAKIAVDGQDCGTSQICVQKVVNTNTWNQTCRTDVPLSMRTCTTKTNYTLNDITAPRTKPTELCEEKRTTATYACTSEAVLVGATPTHCPDGTRLVNTAAYLGPYNDPYALLRVTCGTNDTLHIQWSTSISGTEFDNASIYGSTIMAVDTTIQLNPFNSSDWTSAGKVCAPGYDNGLTNYFKSTCDGTTCTYTMKTTAGGNCAWSSIAPVTSGTANVAYDGVFNYIDQCTSYENASQ